MSLLVLHLLGLALGVLVVHVHTVSPLSVAPVDVSYLSTCHAYSSCVARGDVIPSAPQLPDVCPVAVWMQEVTSGGSLPHSMVLYIIDVT